MRDLHKLVLIIPVVIVLAAVLFKMQGGDIDLTSNDGSIVISHMGEDYDLSAPGSSALTFSRTDLAPDPGVPTLSITSDPSIDVDMDLHASESAQYHLQVDIPALQSAVGAAVETHVWDPNPPQGASNIVPLHQLRIDVQPPFATNYSNYSDSDDSMTYTLQLDGGIAGQVITSTGANSNPDYEDIDLSVTGRTGTELEVASSAAGTNAIIPAATSTEAGLMLAADKAKTDALDVTRQLPTGAADDQVLTWDDNASPAAPVWEAPSASRSVHHITLTTYSSSDNSIEGALSFGDASDVTLGDVLIFATPASLPNSSAQVFIRITGAGSSMQMIGHDSSLLTVNDLIPNRVYWAVVQTPGNGIRLLSHTGDLDLIHRAEVTVSAAQIRTLDTTPVEIIASPGAGKYLVIEEAWIVKSGTEAAVETPTCPSSSPRTPTAGCIRNASISVMFIETQVTPNQPFHIYTDSIYRVFLSGFYNARSILAGEEYNYGEAVGGHAFYSDTPLSLGVWYNFTLSDNWSDAAWDAFTASLTNATSFKFMIFYKVKDAPDLS